MENLTPTCHGKKCQRISDSESHSVMSATLCDPMDYTLCDLICLMLISSDFWGSGALSFFFFLSWMTYSFHSSGFQNKVFDSPLGWCLKLFRAKTQSMTTICTTCPWISPAQVSNPPISASACWFLAPESHFSKALFLHVRPHQWNISGSLWKRCQF